MAIMNDLNDIQQARLLVVDDEPTNRILLRHMLKPLGCRIEEAESAAQGLLVVETFKPHLVLLDVMMPKTTGFEMCETLKKMPEFAAVPVIFITALTDVQEKVRGFAVGGSDYICKPFQKEEVVARIRLQIELLSQRIALQRHAETLEEMVQTRTRQLLHADRLITIGTMAAKILHEINNPLTLILGNLQIIQENLGGIPAETRPLIDSCVADAIEGARRISHIADGIRQYSRRYETRTTQRHALKPLIEEAVRLMHPRLKHHFTVRIEVPDDLHLKCNSSRLQQVFMNLMANSVDAAEKGEILFKAHAEPGVIRLIYEDDGPGIPEELREKIFESFFTTKGPEKGTGIGMTIIQEILREHGGDIVLGRREGRGVRFDIRLDPEGGPQNEPGPTQRPRGGGGAA